MRILLLLASLCVAAEEEAPRDLGALLREVRLRHGLPGMVGAIVAGGRVTAQGADGVRRHGAEERVTLEDRFHLGSCTKAMTATLCAMLVEEGMLAWGSTLGEVFPDLSPRMDPAWRGVTLEQLLHHRGGAPAGLDAGGLWGRLWAHKGTPAEARRALLEGVVVLPLEAPPGTKTIYSNGGYAIAGAMAEKVTGKAWEELMRARLFLPLGMTSAGFGAPGASGALDQPRGHTAAGLAVEPGPGADNPVAIGPAGIAHATVGDWAKFVALHLRGEKDGSKLLSKEGFAQLHAQDGDHAKGWVVTTRPWGGGRVLTHSGSNTLWFCTVWIAPERDFAVLVMTNQGGDKAAKACDEACAAMIQDHLRPG